MPHPGARVVSLFLSVPLASRLMQNSIRLHAAIPRQCALLRGVGNKFRGILAPQPVVVASCKRSREFQRDMNFGRDLIRSDVQFPHVDSHFARNPN